MRLLYIADIRLPTEKAHGIAIIQMCSAFSHAGVEVELVIPSRHNPITQDPFDYYGIEHTFTITRLSLSDTVARGRLGFWLHAVRFAYAAVQYAKKQPPDILYSRDVLPLLFSRRSQARLFWETHTPRWNSAVAHLVLRLHGVICISGGLAHFYESHGVSHEKIQVAPSGIAAHHLQQNNAASAHIRRELHLAGSTPLVGYVGAYHTMGASKGVDGIVRAVAKLHAQIPSVVLLLVGVGEGGAQVVRAEAARSGLPENSLCIVPRAAPADIPAYLQACDVLVMFFPRAEHYEHYMSPMKVFEYMASGVPIVTSDLPSIREVLSDEDALFVPPEDEAALVRALQDTLLHKKNTALRAERARLKVYQYTWEERARAILAFIQCKN